MDELGAWLNQALLWILDTVQAIDPVARTLFAGLATFLETSLFVGLVVPGDTVVIVASTAVGGPVEAIALAITVIIGTLCGQSVGFLIGHAIGPWLQRSWLGRRIGSERWMRAARYVERRGGVAVFVSRFLPVLHSLMPVTVGMSTMPYRRFIRWATPAAILWGTAYVTVGSLTAGSFRDQLDELHGAGYIFVAVILAFAILIAVVKRVIHWREARHWSMQEEPVRDEPVAPTPESDAEPPATSSTTAQTSASPGGSARPIVSDAG